MVDFSGFEVNYLDYGFSPHFVWCVDIASIGTDRQTQIQGRWANGGTLTSTLSSDGSGKAPGTQNGVPAPGLPSEETACSLALDWAAIGSSRTQSGLEPALRFIHTSAVQNQLSGSHIPVRFRTSPSGSHTPACIERRCWASSPHPCLMSRPKGTQVKGLQNISGRNSQGCGGRRTHHQGLVEFVVQVGLLCSLHQILGRGHEGESER